MKGRREHEIKSNDKMAAKLKKYPSYISDFYDSLTESTYTTKEAYVNNVLIFLNYATDRFGYDLEFEDELSNIKPSNVRAYINSISNLSGGTKASRMYAIKKFFDFLKNDGYIDETPFVNIQMPKDKKEHTITFLTEEEIKKVQYNIMNGVGSDFAKAQQKQWRSRDYAIVMMALSLGLRNSSLTEIDIDDIDLVNNTLKIVEKGNETRTIFFSKKLNCILTDWLQDRKKIVGYMDVKALFISSQKKRIAQRTVAAMIQKYTYNIDKHITPHKLRSTCATNVYNATGDIYLTADVLGHRNISNTRRYAQISEERKKKAATAMDNILF